MIARLDELISMKGPIYKRLFFAGVVLSSATLLALLLGEVVLRIALPFPAQDAYLIWPPNLTRIFLPRPELMPGIFGESRFLTNSRGLRGRESTAQDDTKILCIGGSTTECLYLDQYETWPHLLQTSLAEMKAFGRVWVGNAGKSGLTTRHHLVALRCLPLEELEVKTAVFLVGVNDLSVFIALGDRFVPWRTNDPETEKKLIEETFSAGAASSGLGSRLRKTALWIEMRNIRRWLFAANRQDRVGEIYQQWRKDRQNARAYLSDLPDMSLGLNEYAANIALIISLCRSRGIRPVFMTQPSMWRGDLPDDLRALLWFGGVSNSADRRGRNLYYSVEAMQQAMQAYNLTLIRSCELHRAECIDLAMRMPKDTGAFYDDVHLNEKGARAVARVLSEYLLEHPTK